MKKITVLKEEIALDIGDTFKINYDDKNIIIVIQAAEIKKIMLPKSDKGYYFVKEDEIESDFFEQCLYYQVGHDVYAIIYDEDLAGGILYVWKYPNISVEEVLSSIYYSDKVLYDILPLEEAIKKM